MFIAWSFLKVTLKYCQCFPCSVSQFLCSEHSGINMHPSFTFLIDLLALNMNGCDTVAVKDYFTRTQSFYVVERY